MGHFTYRISKTKSTMIPLLTRIHFSSIARSLEGSRWCITWEKLDSALNAGDDHTAYTPLQHAPLHLTFTPKGFRTDDGFEGLWSWKLHPGGRLVIHINDSHPPGWACYMHGQQQEILMYITRYPGTTSPERMRWMRCD